jgi:hypothetical protein
MARRLALGDRVLWTGEDDRPVIGTGTIIRITAHLVEVLWEGENARRYRREQLHNLRHAPALAETLHAAPRANETPPFRGISSATLFRMR